MSTKQCTVCNIVKNTTEFHKKRADTFDSRCKICKQKAAEDLKKAPKVYVASKKCGHCKKELARDQFSSDIKTVTGLSSWCHECASEKNAEKYKKKPDFYKKRANEHYHNTKHVNKESRLSHNREKQKARLALDALYKIKRNLRNRLWYALENKTWKKDTSFDSYIGCTPEQLIAHIEAKFQDGMSWDNYGLDTWHIDHIIPLDSAKTKEDLYKLCHYTNLQPLKAFENLSKGNRVS